MQFDRDARSEHDDQRHRGGGVGRHRLAPFVQPGSGRNDQEIERRRRGHSADSPSTGSAAERQPREMADGKLALDLETNDK
jgi:hypothetical protein